MKYLIGPLLLAWLSLSIAFGQTPFAAIVTDAKTGQPLMGASVSIAGTTLGAVSDSNGFMTIPAVPDGQQVLIFSYIGYEAHQDTLTFPLATREPITIALSAEGEELEEVLVTSTRSTRSIADEPTRIEVIAAEELEEKTNMNAANISMLLRETPGIQVQQTSATSANQTFRIQGLDGRYTQLLQNGLPLYSGFASGLSLLQIPPLDLRQVEIIKGSQSTLYGGGAIAGIVNLVTKEPGQERENLLLLNGTSGGGLDLNGFFSGRGEKLGYTLYLSRNTQRGYDPNQDQFTDIPQSRRFTVNPRLFWYLSERTSADAGLNVSVENRIGGDLATIRDGAGGYTERNISNRYTTQFNVQHQLTDQTSLYAKNSLTWFNRDLTTPNYTFGGRQQASFSEAGISRYGKKLEWVGGLNLWTDTFQEQVEPVSNQARNYTLNTVGAFLQNNFKYSASWTLETGLRLDHQPIYGTFLLPRFSLMAKLSDQLTSRLGGGLGYKAPTVFSEEAEQRLYQGVLPIEPRTTEAETSQGINWDFNYRTELTEGLQLTLNHLFFYTRIQRPLVLESEGANQFVYRNANGHLDTRGFETNVTWRFANYRLYSFYTFTDTKRYYENLQRPLPLTARHRAGVVAMYELEEKWRVGYEAYYTGQQELEAGTRTRPYWTMGLMAERRWEHISLFLNFENFTDVRLSRFQTLVSGPRQQPEFVREIWAPTEGRIINGGVKFRF
ncbi:TonB-dependent receptor [Telluribacter humicola]|uniref:TonB-dependent receptor n=1 Tax=Telluribacter humicola TaxID=1720261 RepID=UPI001A95F042|nr:TonB-dependent receptor [Telluribacter humicola]